MSPDLLRRAVITLAGHTGWSLAALQSMTVDQLFDWLNACPKTPSRHAQKSSP